MRSVSLLVLMLLSTPALAQRPEPEGQRVVVTGPSLQEYRDRLAACLARRCPTNEDADATLALAEALFLDGDYRDARAAVRASLRRNRGQARTYPEPVSDLHRANARLARHIGLDRQARTSTFDILNALQEGIPAEDHRHFTARFEIAEMQMMSGNFPGARRELGRLVQVARAAGRGDVVTIAELRDLWYELIAFPASDARGRLVQWSRLTDPAERMRAIGAKMMLARLYRGEGDEARAAALIAEIGRSGASTRRRLLHAPPYQLAQQEMRLEGDQDLLTGVAYGRTLNRQSDNFEDSWIDVGFWILPNGQVSGVEIVRRGANTAWSRPLVDSIGERVYSQGPEATYRLERYAYTAAYEQVAESRLPRRSPAARIEYFDLTNGDETPRPPPSEGDGGDMPVD